MRIFLLFILSIMQINYCSAAELTLVQALQLGWAEHPDLQISDQDLTLAAQSVWLQKETFRPQASLQSKARYGEKVDSLSIAEAVTVKSSQGTEIAAMLEQWAGDENIGLGLSVTQPLLKGRTKAYNLYGLRVATLGQVISEYQYQMTEQMILQKIIFAYRALQLATLNLHLQAHLLQGTERLGDMIEKKIQLGKMPEIEGAHIRLQVQKERVVFKEMQDNSALAWLKFWDALGVEPDLKFDTVSLPHDEDVTSMDKNSSIEEGLNYDLNLKILNLTKTQAEHSLQKVREDAWWDLDLKFESNLRTAHKEKGSKAATLMLNVPLADKKKNLKIENQAIALRKINLTILEQKRKIQINLETLWKNLENLKIQKQSSKQWLILAQESLSLAQKKFELGRSSMMEVMHYTDQLQLAEIQYTKITIAVLNAKTELDVATGQLLEVWRDKAKLH